MPMNKRIQFRCTIGAPVEKVYMLMLDAEVYREWTVAFAEGSFFEGSWRKGEKILFLGPSGDGMVAEIAENRPNEFVSIRHIGMIANGVEDTESDAVKAWTPAYENYTFEASAEGTTVIVDMDVNDSFEQYMLEKWPKALEKLKAICEAA